MQITFLISFIALLNTTNKVLRLTFFILFLYSIFKNSNNVNKYINIVLIGIYDYICQSNFSILLQTPVIFLLQEFDKSKDNQKIYLIIFIAFNLIINF